MLPDLLVQPDHLTETLAAIPGQRARLSIGPAERPFPIRPDDEEEHGLTWLLMPVRRPSGDERGGDLRATPACFRGPDVPLPAARPRP
ncbi:hypothetical protein PWG71_16405 [Nocardiopsis sp. N85]|uniref:hypothetical protein n=1 Tax=Nocardiopsis sp. N85 TaxID=3029400 RepID=UPI00237FAF90|nr:hypothetical protein [Nocardiopsis sp. N85]MDE3722972.1 hypothetical protein [Nocardiopsis sp. N85]